MMIVTHPAVLGQTFHPLQSRHHPVIRGSIFESVSGESQSPTVMLKLLYHWSCQTNIPNVANWVKVDNKKIDHFYKLMRSVCVAAVQECVVARPISKDKDMYPKRSCGEGIVQLFLMGKSLIDMTGIFVVCIGH